MNIINIQDFLKEARRVLNEDAGSEGLTYTVKASAGLKALDNDELVIEDVHQEDGETVATVKFRYPHDYGFALMTLKQQLEDLNITSLALVY